MMRTVPITLAGLVLVLAPQAAADPFDLYEEVTQIGAWAVLCDFEDDMGGREYFDCAVASTTDPMLVVSDLSSSPGLTLQAGDGAVVLGDHRIEAATCSAEPCVTGLSLDEIEEALAGGPAIEPSATTMLSGSGFREAVADAIGRLD